MSGEIRIGVLATLLGPFAVMGEDGLRGVELAISEVGGMVAGKKITYITETTNAIPQSAVDGCVKLLDIDKVDFVIGPLSGNEGQAIRDFARTRPDKVFINGIAGAQDITFPDPAPNFYSFSTNGVQWMAGLGKFVYEQLGYRRVVTLGEDYSFPYSQVSGFLIDFCRAGGKVVEKFWVPLGTRDYSRTIAALPENTDAIFVALGGADGVLFLRQFDQANKVIPLIGGTLTVDQTVLSTKGSLTQRIIGIASSGPIADSNPDPAWQNFVKTYRQKFPNGLHSPSLFCFGYYLNTKAALLALAQVEGDLSDGQVAFGKALACLSFETPTGPVRLDQNRNAIANVFITLIEQEADGTLYQRLAQVVPAVNQTLGIPEAEYMAYLPIGRDHPSCL